MKEENHEFKVGDWANIPGEEFFYIDPDVPDEKPEVSDMGEIPVNKLIQGILEDERNLDLRDISFRLTLDSDFPQTREDSFFSAVIQHIVMELSEGPVIISQDPSFQL